MTGMVAVKTNFTSGQVSDKIYGRGDLSLYENGAKTLENVIIHPTGGVSRRRGLKYVDKVSQNAKLVPFEFSVDQIYLLCLFDKKMRIYREDEFIAEIDTPWTSSQLNQLNWTQSADTLLVVHPDVEPKKITRNNGEVWKIEDWDYYAKYGMIFCPYFNFYQHKTKINYFGLNGILYITSEEEIFSPDYVGIKIKLGGGLVEVTSFSNTKTVIVKSLKSANGGTGITDWEEQSFSKLRGFPRSITFHQDRLVIGGSKGLPNRLWFSKSSDLFNFDLGTGLDDEAIEFAILSDQINAICNLISSRHLLIFTTGAEWTVSGETLTPTSISLSCQTNTGSYIKSNVAPQQINGATVFVSRNGKQFNEFLYTDTEQAYLSKNLTLLSDEIISAPVSICFSQYENVVYLVLEDGTVSCLTSYRTEEVTAWSKLKTNGKFISSAVIGDEIYFAILREGGCFIEKFSDELFADCAQKMNSEVSKTLWSGLEIYEGKEVCVASKGYVLGKFMVTNGEINLFDTVDEIQVGIPYEHLVESLPYMIESLKPYPPRALRVVEAIFRIINSKAFSLKLADEYVTIPLKRIYRDKILDAPAENFSGDLNVRSLKWVRDMKVPIWSIKSDDPVSFNLLMASAKLNVKI
ncbi:MAG: hypothetical protein ACK5N8_07420 [Alphaproteobacteria bacterium]